MTVYPMAHTEHLGRVGLWSAALRAEGPARGAEVSEAVAELDELGYRTIWLGGSPSPDQIEPLLAATSRATVGSSILSIWDHTATEVAARHAELNDAYDGRFLLGLGVSHDETKGEPDHPLAHRPYTALRAYLDELDAARRPVPVEQRALAALGPRMLELAGQRALGALPYLVTTEHTAQARAALGPEPLLAPELKVVLTQDGPGGRDQDSARGAARAYLSGYLQLANYRNSLLRLGFAESDLMDGGSDRLIDAVYAIGDPEAVRRRVNAYFAAGADHVAVQVVTENTATDLPRDAWRALAEALPLA